MYDTLTASTRQAGSDIHVPDRAAPQPALHAGNQVATSGETVFAALLDEFDYGVVLLREGARVGYLNQAARRLLGTEIGVELVEGTLRARSTRDASALAEGLTAVARGLRRLVSFTGGARPLAAAFVPLAQTAAGERLSVLVFGRSRLCERLSLQWLARAHGLTPAESTVLELLADGLDPSDVARVNEVGMATIRTQVKDIREKLGVKSLRGLIHLMAQLPPMPCTLRN